MKEVILKYCPVCKAELSVIKGKESGIYKLYCSNDKCDGSLIKKLIKGLSILEIKNLGPSTIEKLYDVGVRDVVDVFDNSIVNEENLIKSNIFKKGKTLDNILKSIKSVKEINIDKFINSLQLEVDKENNKNEKISIGKSLSSEIAKILSNQNYDLTGLSIQIRKDLEKDNSELLNIIKEKISIIEKFGVKINFLEKKKTKKKKIKKLVSLDSKETNLKKEVEELDWIVTENVKESELLIVDDKNNKSQKIQEAKENSIKIITYKQFKIVFL
jgi:hypothetical protein